MRPGARFVPAAVWHALQSLDVTDPTIALHEIRVLAAGQLKERASFGLRASQRVELMWIPFEGDFIPV